MPCQCKRAHGKNIDKSLRSQKGKISRCRISQAKLSKEGMKTGDSDIRTYGIAALRVSDNHWELTEAKRG